VYSKKKKDFRIKKLKKIIENCFQSHQQRLGNEGIHRHIEFEQGANTQLAPDVKPTSDFGRIMVATNIRPKLTSNRRRTRSRPSPTKIQP